MFFNYHDYDFSGEIESTNVTGASGAGTDIYNILIIVCVVLLGISIIFSIIMFIKVCSMNNRLDNISIKIGNMDSQSNGELGIVFCKKCGSKYGVNEKKCPYCGTKK